ncbi:class I SAM-dependent methyltransferase [Polynucleobacter difficilis]|uniref:class I SAM-dependent methyltransferase n=1 Tax=Polynucleobacter difficilis TaxID=556054 RepID=UPI000D3452BA|nr:class I SAM-dependent methyltransferase [Polynucleobacter difficilis]
MKGYYEFETHWKIAADISSYELARYKSGADLIPDDVVSLVDIGCGNGGFLASIERQIGRDIKLQGFERSASAISNKLCKTEIVKGDIDRLDFGNQKVDLVSCLAVLEHLPEALEASLIGKMIDLTSKYILIDVPYKERRVRVACPSCGCRFDPHLHLRSYAISDIEKRFPAFKVKKKLVLSGPESLLTILIRFFRIEVSASLGGPKICPQCGTNSKEVLDSAEVGNRGERYDARLKSLLKKIQPKFILKREVFLLLEKI